MANGIRSEGFTLIELMVVIVIAAILATIAIPALGDFIKKARVRGAAEALHADLMYARSEAVLRSQDITVSITGGADWCYGLNAGGTCNCATAGSCSIKSVAGSTFNGTALTSNFTSLTFDGTQGTISGAGGTIGTDTVLIGNALGQAGVKLLPVSVKLCAPSSYAATMGYPSC
ncbi:GspH/FimT family pseudopilin [Aromatoleum aromaticum]|uniref:Type II secretion system protein H n=1 Tax=Aromatoleum aromaticum (strain DSM 19018 / LMG 30748 / EbN1) TaxID=76114 RepID=Q5P0Y7_AROAE|nr:GspH/FimT family pseudopilin [Aromatoleum aromaticum]NMG54156.1 type II secretion system protein GspH [Aromatoleum aromaticum]CAI09027.1 fimbrial protein pilin similar to FimU [Aromatoleum aromaticum EbN1]